MVAVAQEMGIASIRLVCPNYFDPGDNNLSLENRLVENIGRQRTNSLQLSITDIQEYIKGFSENKIQLKFASLKQIYPMGQHNTSNKY